MRKRDPGGTRTPAAGFICVHAGLVINKISFAGAPGDCEPRVLRNRNASDFSRVAKLRRMARGVRPRRICHRVGAAPSAVSVYSSPPIWWAQPLSRSTVDEFVPHTQHVSLRTVGEPSLGRVASQNRGERHQPPSSHTLATSHFPPTLISHKVLIKGF